MSSLTKKKSKTSGWGFPIRKGPEASRALVPSKPKPALPWCPHCSLLFSEYLFDHLVGCGCATL
jgi:hypothetical protein